RRKSCPHPIANKFAFHTACDLSFCAWFPVLGSALKPRPGALDHQYDFARYLAARVRASEAFHQIHLIA
ncbi:MAG: hypothetical protein ACRYHA_24620, partial [Janthinobacterium lividum]